MFFIPERKVIEPVEPVINIAARESSNIISKVWGKITSVLKKGTAKAEFKTQELLDTHFKKHVDEFGNITKEQYLKGAQKLVSSKSGDNILTKARQNGDIIFYNKATNEFAIKTADGKLRTYFKPTDGINYFNKQQ